MFFFSLGLNTLSENKTLMKSLHTLVSESKLAGSAGTVTSTVLVSTETTPKGTPPSLKVTETIARDHMDKPMR